MTGRTRRLTGAGLAAGAAVLALAASRPGAVGAPSVKDGGTFRLTALAADFDYIDPALAYSGVSWALLDASCVRLMGNPDQPAPEGLRTVPELATAAPRVSNGGKTFTFTLRTNFRFSNGTPVRANAFARGIDRVLAAGRKSHGTQYMADIVGARAVIDGKATHASGVVARGNRLAVTLTGPAGDFPARTTMPFFCAVPPDLPSDPEGFGAFPGSGPYYVSEYVRGQRVVLERNPYYRGGRPHHVDRFVLDFEPETPQAVLSRIERGDADWGSVGPPDYYDPALNLVKKYGLNGPQFFVKPGLASRGFALNVTRPLFRNNLALRRAVSFAVDRAALINVPGLPRGEPTDQFLPRSVPGFRDARIYPLRGPDLRKAKALARGHTRTGKAVLWTFNVPPALSAAQIVKRDLKQIGLDVSIKGIPFLAYWRVVSQPGAEFDIAFGPWFPDYIDPFQYVNVLFDGQFVGANNIGHFDDPKYNALMRNASRLQGSARYRAYGRLDVQLARDAVPSIPISIDSWATFVSKRVGCVVLRPTLDLTAVCLR